MSSPTLSPRAAVTLVIADDNPGSLEMLSTGLRQEGLEIRTYEDPEVALEYILNEHPQIVLTDLVMPNMTGMELLERVVEFDPAIDVILMTAHYSSESAVEAIRKGAADYLDKPIALATLRDRVGQLVERHRRRTRAHDLEASLAASTEFEGMVGNSPQMWQLISQVQRVAPHYRSVLVVGQTGTGKELVARALHNLSPVKQGQFVALNCSAVVETLFESELFGHVRGSFTGATQDKIGLYEFAHNGTLFLDEIGDMPLNTQAKLLRALQNQEVQRLGSLVPKKVNVRVIAATHRDLRSLMAEHKFREDLFYRLTMVELQVPSLVDRDGDLLLLVRHFLQRFAQLYHKEIRGLTNRAQLVLLKHQWPGNIRELENVIGHACIMVMGSLIDVGDLPSYLVHPHGEPHFAMEAMPPMLLVPTEPAPVAPVATTPAAPAGPTELPSLDEQEKRLLMEALDKAKGNQSLAARLLRISRDTLRYRMKKHAIGTAEISE
jgi:DNA-binding NtrC family response regulator